MFERDDQISNLELKRNRLYTIVNHNSKGEAVSVEPTEYLQGLSPSKAIAEVKAYAGWVAINLKQCSHGTQETVESFRKTKRLLYELEIAHRYLVHLQKAYLAKASRYRLR